MTRDDKPADVENYKEVMRDFKIQQKEEERKRKEEQKNIERRRKLLEKKESQQKRDAKSMEQQTAYYQQMRLRKQQQEVETEYRNRCRETQIEKKREAWLRNSNDKLHDMLDAHHREEEEINARLTEAKRRRNAQKQSEAAQREEVKHQNAMLESKREQAEAKREADRKEKSLELIERLKSGQEIELAKIQEDLELGKPIVAKKSALVASLTECPTVSELLCALKKQKIDIDDLMATDVERRAKLHGLPLFKHVKKMDEIFEASKFPIPTGQVTLAAKSNKS